MPRHIQEGHYHGSAVNRSSTHLAAVPDYSAVLAAQPQITGTRTHWPPRGGSKGTPPWQAPSRREATGVQQQRQTWRLLRQRWRSTEDASRARHGCPVSWASLQMTSTSPRAPVPIPTTAHAMR